MSEEYQSVTTLHEGWLDADFYVFELLQLLGAHPDWT